MRLIQKKIVTFTTCLLCLMLSGCDKPTARPPEIVYVDLSRVLKETGLLKQEENRNQQIKTLLADAERMMQQGCVKNEPAQQKCPSGLPSAFNQVWAAEKNQTRQKSLNIIAQVTEEYRVSHHLSLVLNRNLIIAGTPEQDMTSEIIGLLKDVPVNYGALPKISVNKQPGGSGVKGE